MGYFRFLWGDIRPLLKDAARTIGIAALVASVLLPFIYGPVTVKDFLFGVLETALELLLFMAVAFIVYAIVKYKKYRSIKS